ncbi:imidazole glycerol phosphate synthase subunit HisH [Rhizorhabdus sp.]|uniref:imidazole glycerol phosphate synthase subunit HisH n=1 Tax=Rhizorhabdus sp. TaxID=1968843 RepID=UPI0019B7BED4|nr:imidazole glycerol phosphate synthase subunit HisH [Rhizorhabdus sp.]MBD3760742.1 imidazole glycerol phosphate synthase subunit HisH [Rhizorhabdus sp.]
MITVVDYGVGNVRAFLNIYKQLNIPARLGSAPRDIETAERLILPGVGAFDWAMGQLDASGLRAPLDAAVLERGVPVLGICVGMQMMAGSSEEGSKPGLGWIDGRVRRLADGTGTNRMLLPHMGWNDIVPQEGHALFVGLASPPRFYFLHSYYFETGRPGDTIARCDYHGRFACAVGHGHILGVQFHPEKSHGFGISLLKNFADIQPC